MTAFLAIIFSAFGGVWRRMFGGWLGLSRAFLAVLSLLLIAPGLLWMPWIMGQDSACRRLLDVAVVRWTRMDRRKGDGLSLYGFPSACIAALSTYWACLLIGPAIAAGYWIVQREIVASRLPYPNEALDGEIAYAEVFAGVVAALIFNLSGAL